MNKTIYLKIFTILILILGLQACSSSTSLNRLPSGLNPSTCSEMMRAIIKNNQASLNDNQILLSQVNRAIDANITTKRNLEQLLQDQFYKEAIFRNESNTDLESSALIVELIRKSHPNISPNKVVKRYHLLFNTCGI